jgi:hypothetical protein
VLRVYLPTCLPDELLTVFGPISSYLVEDQTGQNLIEFSFDGNQLRERRIDLMPDDAAGGKVSPEPANGG